MRFHNLKLALYFGRRSHGAACYEEMLVKESVFSEGCRVGDTWGVARWRHLIGKWTHPSKTLKDA